MKALPLLLLLLACDDDTTTQTTDAEPLVPAADAGMTGQRITSAACTQASECKGGTCLGSPLGPETGNLRFMGGYCTTLGCTANTQEGCGPDEFCIDGDGLGTFCVQQCSKADGVGCDRSDHVCLGLGTFGGCFSSATVECNSQMNAGCQTGEICVRIGFEDPSLGRCEQLCDPTSPACPPGDGCYYIRRYDTAFCGDPGATKPEEPCSCDKCCEPDFSCAPDLDGLGRHCKPVCGVASGCQGGQCVPLESGSPFGGCVVPGSAGT